MSFMKTTFNSYMVYFGPSTISYPTLGSVSAKETVSVLWQDNSWYYISYDVAGTNKKKCGYVQSKYVSCTQHVYNFSDLCTGTSGPRYVNTSQKTYTGDNDNLFVEADSLLRSKKVYYLGYKSNNYALIEYNIDDTMQKKRAFFFAMYLSTEAIDALPRHPDLMKMLTIAQGEISQKEQKDHSTKYGQWYGKKAGDLSFAVADWCAMFLSWCADQANLLTSTCPANAPYLYFTASVKILYDFFDKSNRKLLAVNSIPQPGDIALFSNIGSLDRANLSHVAIVSSYDLQSKTVTYIEGNSAANNVQSNNCTNDGRYLVYLGR